MLHLKLLIFGLLCVANAQNQNPSNPYRPVATYPPYNQKAPTAYKQGSTPRFSDKGWVLPVLGIGALIAAAMAADNFYGRPPIPPPMPPPMPPPPMGPPPMGMGGMAGPLPPPAIEPPPLVVGVPTPYYVKKKQETQQHRQHQIQNQ